MRAWRFGGFLALGACAGPAPRVAAAPPVVHEAPALLVSDSSTWGLTGRDYDHYAWTLDPSVRWHGRPTMRLEPREDQLARAIVARAGRPWAASYFDMPAVGLRGKRVRFSVDVRTASAPEGAWAWLRIDGNDQLLCNMQNPVDQRLKGTNDFTSLSCVLDVAEDARRIVFGVGLSDVGRAWVGPGKLETVGADVPASASSHPPLGWAFSRGDPEALGVDGDALARFRQRAADTGASALLVIKDGKAIEKRVWDSDDGPIETMGITTAIASLAIGALLDEGKLASVDVPLSTWFPAWTKDAHKSITLRMILDHTSCLESARTTEKIYAADDWVKLALDAPVVCTPGERAFYNNTAVNLLAPIVERLSGKRLDAYVHDTIFAPLGITDYQWATDRAGHPQVMAGLALRPIALAMIGQMMLDGGTWKGKRVLSASFVQQATQADEPHSSWGFLWARHRTLSVGYDDEHLRALRQAGVAASTIAKLETIKGQWFDTTALARKLSEILGIAEREAIRRANDRVIAKLGGDVAVRWGPQTAYDANGWLGQYLVVVPRTHMVVVRMQRATRHGANGAPAADFDDEVLALASR